MRRVLVPLDGSDMAIAIFSDAARLAGPEGELILVHDVDRPAYDPNTRRYNDKVAVDQAQEYLAAQAEELRAQGIRAEARPLVFEDVPLGIDEAADLFEVDAIACATHGRGPFGRLMWGGIARRTLVHSPVPVLLKHVDDGVPVTQAKQRKIMVPLDGSALAQTAVPLAVALAHEWNAPLHLVQVLPGAPWVGGFDGDNAAVDAHVEEARAYLKSVAERIPIETRIEILIGGVVEELERAVRALGITDAVLATHGRSGLSRVVLGSVADGLVHRLRIPVIAIPAFAAAHAARKAETREPVTVS